MLMKHIKMGKMVQDDAIYEWTPPEEMDRTKHILGVT